eukprot:8546680-Alexandrium_andersonii.AAC.1
MGSSGTTATSSNGLSRLCSPPSGPMMLSPGLGRQAQLVSFRSQMGIRGSSASFRTHPRCSSDGCTVAAHGRQRMRTPTPISAGSVWRCP